MKVYLEATHFAVDKSRQHLKLEEVQYLLDRHKHIQIRRFLKELARIVVNSDGFFSSLPASLIAELVVEFFDFLETGQDRIALKTRPLLNGKQYLLVISAPNVSYLVETLELLQRKYSHQFNLLAHPVLSIKRREQGIIGLNNNVEAGCSELFILVRLENVEQQTVNLVREQSRTLLEQVYRVYQFSSRFNEQLENLATVNELQHFRALLTWLRHDAFVPVYYQKITQNLKSLNDSTDDFVGADLSACLDIFNPDHEQQLIEEINGLLSRETDAVVHKLTARSPLLGNDALVYIGLRDTRNNTRVEHGFIGLFRNIEINCASCHDAALQKKIEATLAKIRITKGSHDFIKLQEIFSLIPKLELFFMGETQLDFVAQSLCRYLCRPRSLKVLFLASPSPLCISLLIIIPHAFQGAALKNTLAETMCTELGAEVSSVRLINYGESFSALYLSLIPQQESLHIDIVRLEKLLNRNCRPWLVHFRLLLDRAFGKREGGELWRKYHDSFGADYQNTLPPRYAVKDLKRFEETSMNLTQSINLLTPCCGQEYYRLHFYSIHERFLDEYIPVLENLNLRLVDQVQFSVTVMGAHLFIKSFAVMSAVGSRPPLQKMKSLLLAMIKAILQQRVENDGLNRLLLLTGMGWQEIDVLRLYRNYCMQLSFHVTISSFHRALLNNPLLARLLYDYFEVRFRPVREWEDSMLREEQGLFPIRLRLLQDMETVSDLNDDRILRTVFNLIDSTVRSNFHVRKDLDDYFIAIKINSLGVLEMPSPRPSYEIYVHAADMEGIHLRGGKISRGGIRWSDRPDDFRMEILGLMQTQMSKNALIVPTGAKGGFVVKRLHHDENFKQAGKRAYRQLMRALLDLTDNYVNKQVNTLPGIIRYDDVDPYLVVAADKGTAQFPDVANAVAVEYRFWLGDAFASGGSHGYNHKALGITARGAWESIKRHFRELDKDIQTQTFTVVGIGSMDGDVFGNGMLLSRCIKLRAAISGQHIFLDPDPEPETSFQERRRLFDLPGSSWDDYQRSLVSDGGGVYLRDSKDIPITESIRQWLGIRYKTLDGETLIRYLLTAPTELLWLGGIGTYVKASSEKHEEVGDRQNDNVRVDACDIKAKVVGEGANLGFTREARIEFALAGGYINTDAIDNSAGVDTSDHEVNLKILLRDLHNQGKVDDYQALFDQLAEPVCQSVLNDNYAQTLCLSLERIRCDKHPSPFLDLADKLSLAGFLDFAVEAFPSAKTVLARDKIKFTRPELAVLMASAKRWLTQQLLDMPEFVSASCCDYYLLGYFPQSLVESFAGDVALHPLASAIKATCISNLLINQVGCSFVTGVIDNPPKEIADLVSTYLTFDRILEGSDFRAAVFALDNRVDAFTQYQILLKLENCLVDFCVDSIANNARLHPEPQLIADYQEHLSRFLHQVEQHEGSRLSNWATVKDKLPEVLFHRLLWLDRLKDFPASVQLVGETGSTIESIVDLYVEITELLCLETVQAQFNVISLQDNWERKMFKELQLGICMTQSRFVSRIIRSGYKTARDYFSDQHNQVHFHHYQRSYQEVATAMHRNLMPYLVWYKELVNLLVATEQE